MKNIEPDRIVKINPFVTNRALPVVVSCHTAIFCFLVLAFHAKYLLLLTDVSKILLVKKNKSRTPVNTKILLYYTIIFVFLDMRERLTTEATKTIYCSLNF